MAGTTANQGASRNSGTLTLDQSVVANNASASSGGGIGNHGTLTIGRSTISANVAYGAAGGIYNDDEGQLIIRNSTLSTNRPTTVQRGSITRVRRS